MFTKLRNVAGVLFVVAAFSALGLILFYQPSVAGQKDAEKDKKKGEVTKTDEIYGERPPTTPVIVQPGYVLAVKLVDKRAGNTKVTYESEAFVPEGGQVTTIPLDDSEGIKASMELSVRAGKSVDVSIRKTGNDKLLVDVTWRDEKVAGRHGGNSRRGCFNALRQSSQNRRNRLIPGWQVSAI